jgi:Arc/MetJ-type ribon-helix-helix transcriptional regulator
MSMSEVWKSAIEKALADFNLKVQALREEISKIEQELEAKRALQPSELFAKIAALRTELRACYVVLRNELKSIFSSAKVEARDMPHEEAHDLLDELEDAIGEAMDSAEELRENLLGELEELREKVKESWRESLREIRKKVEVERRLEATPSGQRQVTPSVVISSVRLPEADLKIIDSLVEAGIFKSRNEAIAFFIHRGIEASKDWLEKINATLENIRKLQEEAKKEIMSMFGGRGEGGSNAHG